MDEMREAFRKSQEFLDYETNRESEEESRLGFSIDKTKLEKIRKGVLYLLQLSYCTLSVKFCSQKSLVSALTVSKRTPGPVEIF
jgi:hypothetical protein